MTEKEKKYAGKIPGAEIIYAVFWQRTKCPYVICDPDSFDDECCLAFDEESAKKKAASMSVPGLVVAKIEKKDKIGFLASLMSMGINVMRICADEEEICLQMGDVMKRTVKNEEPGKVWVENRELFLTGIYFAQHAMNRDAAGKEEYKALFEELVTNLNRGSLIVPRKDARLPLLKTAKGESFMPVFTDALEYRKFDKNLAYTAAVVKGADLSKLLPPEASGVAINPMSINLPLKMQRKMTADATVEKVPAN